MFEERRPPPPHQFEEWMLLPVIDPRTRSSFRVAIVESIIDNLHFVVSLLEEPQVWYAPRRVFSSKRRYRP